MDLRRQLAVIRQWLLLIVVAVGLAAAAAYFVSSRLPKVYDAKATLIVGQSLTAVNPDYNALLVSQRLSQTYATVARLMDGAKPGAEASLTKLFWSELDVRIHTTALRLLGPRATLTDGIDARWLDGFLFALAGPIYAGTNEVQRNVVAERVLGLPKG